MGADYRTILLANFRRYPVMQISDIYKLVHQASLGSEHVVKDLGSVKRWLDQELSDLGTGTDDPLEDPITPDGRILRIHLRPYLAQERDLSVLLEAFIKTANDFHGSIATLENYWAEAIRCAETGELPFESLELQTFGEKMALKSYPAAHHSPAYRDVYRPAYRVVASEFWR